MRPGIRVAGPFACSVARDDAPYDSACFTRSGENGTRRMRTPVASKIALAIAAATGRIDGSPAPVGGDLRMVDQHDVDRLRRLGDVEDRIGQPVDAGHVLAVELDLLPQRAADALHDVALDAFRQPVRVDDLAAVVRDRELARPDLAGASGRSRPRRSPRRACRCAAHRRCRGPDTLLPVWSLRGDGRVCQPAFSRRRLDHARCRADP